MNDDTPQPIEHPYESATFELLTEEQKAVYIHGFIIGLMSGHTEDFPMPVEYYMDIQETMFRRLELKTELIKTDVLDKLKELDIFQLYNASKETK